MNLEDIEKKITPRIRDAGQRYARAKVVDIIELESDRVFAEVRGTELYEVSLVVHGEEETLEYACTCPHFMNGSLCKHVWATLLTANEKEGWIKNTEPVKFILGSELARQSDSDDEYWSDDPIAEILKEERAKRDRSQWRYQLKKLCAHTQSHLSTSENEKLFISISSGGGEFLRVQLHSQRVLKSGKPARLRELSLGKAELARFSGKDAELAALAYAYMGGTLVFGTRQSFLWIGVAQVESFLQPFANAGRLVTGESMKPIAWKADVDCTLRLAIDIARRDCYGINCTLFHPEGLLRRLPEATRVFGGYVFFQDSIWKLPADADATFIEQLSNGEGVFEFPKSAAAEVLQNLAQIPIGAQIELPAELNWERASTAPKFSIVISRKLEVAGVWPVKLECRYGDQIVILPLSGTALADASNRRVYLRHAQLEQQFLEDAQRAGVEFDTLGGHQHKGFYWRLNKKDISRLAEFCSAESVPLAIDDRPTRYLKDLKFSVSTGVDWFDLQILDEKDLKLAAILDSSKTGWLELNDGSVAVLPQELLTRLVKVADVADVRDNAFRFYSTQSLILDRLLYSLSEAVTFDQPFLTMREQLQYFSRIVPMEPPQGFYGELRGYQKEGLAWLVALNKLGLGGVLADDMGLGKTIQVLAFLQTLKNEGNKEPTLIVVPRSLVSNWCYEAQRFCPELTVLDYSTNSRNELRSSFLTRDIVVTTYSIARIDAEFLSTQNFRYVILDEGQNIKNSGSQVAKAVRVLRCKRRLALTGTPIENSLHDLYALLDFLNPGMIRGSKTLTALTEFETEPDGGQLAQLAKILRPILLRRTKEKVLNDLPPKVEEVLYCDLDEGETEAYKRLLGECRVSLSKSIADVGMGRTKIHVLEAILRLRQLACHQGLAFKERGKQGSSSKFDLLLESLEELIASGHKALVFSSFASLLELLSKHLHKNKIAHVLLTGATTNRQSLVDTFQNNADLSVFLLSLKAGGVGLNLTAADYCFILDPWWNPAAEAQAIDRAHRIGQNKTVFSYRIVSRGTIEEKILELQNRKRGLAQAILRQDEGFVSAMTPEDLQFLLSD